MRYRGISVDSPPTPAPASDYRRQARRLRHEHAGNPIRLHQSLAQLADAQPAAAPKPPVRSMDVEDFFAELVAAELTGPVLTYSKRLELIREAERRGISRFQANLIIAQVQYQTPVDQASDDSHGYPWLSIAMMFFATQGFIALLIWLTIF